MIFERQQLEAFATVVETQNLGMAATRLNVTRGALSQRIKSLEEAAGTLLVVRDQNTPTAAGQALLRHIRVLEILEADTLEQFKPTNAAHLPITIAVNADSLATWFEIVAFEIMEKKVALELLVGDVDYALPLLAGGAAMGCISTSDESPSGFRAESIGAMEYTCVANPGFAERFFSLGMSLHSILDAPAVLANRESRLHAAFLYSVLGLKAKGYTGHFFPSPSARLNAIERGVGYGLVPGEQAQPWIDSGKLMVLAPEHKVTVDLYWHHWEIAPENVQAISKFIVRRARERLIQPASGMMPEVDRDNSVWE
ncbi:transcriptional regulator [Burkholderia sp. Ch1-1]|nr:transcriptional regulator [Burkholderia sp. Ch1-1]